ncbi:MAG: hypothetical protein KKE20_01500 [Nanoarchaeota archaeon]|nr:hypothetical protein [Nanoarchaeota archaeon]
MNTNISSEKLVESYSQGMSLRAISREEGISPNTVKKYLLLQGFKVDIKNIIHGLKNNDDLLIGLYLGIWAGDGTQFLDNGYTIKICCDSRTRYLIEFYQNFLLQLFDKKSRVATESGNNRAFIIFKSKFIYKFVYYHLNFEDKKTYSVHLKRPVLSYSKRFLQGFLLGLALTDGYLNKKFYFNTTSPKLAEDAIGILSILGFDARKYVHNRKKYGWKDLHMVSLRKEESYALLCIFDKMLKNIGSTKSFSALKGYGEMGPP